MARRHDFALDQSCVRPFPVSDCLPSKLPNNLPFLKPPRLLSLTLGSLEQRLHPTWAALTTSTFRRAAVENTDGYTVLTIPEKARTTGSHFISWEFIAASLCT